MARLGSYILFTFRRVTPHAVKTLNPRRER
jgi:hypothetical protein